MAGLSAIMQPLREDNVRKSGPRAWNAALAISAMVMLAGFFAVFYVNARTEISSVGLRGLPVQHIYIVRHGDKYSSYPDCPQKGDAPCFDEPSMGDNAPLTPCGIRQAQHVAEWLRDKDIRHVVASPYARTMQTALPIAKVFHETLKVEYLLSEAMQSEGPHREFNIDDPAPTVAQLQEAHGLWDRHYGSPPIKTPENHSMYIRRVPEAAVDLRARFGPLAGNVVFVTHATPSFSVAYGLCHGSDGDDASLEQFVRHQKPIGPGGVIEIVKAPDGSCQELQQTNNVGLEVGCGATEPFKCDFDDFPSWYWNHSLGKGPGLCQ